MSVSDAAWAPVARSSREALAQLGFHIGPACLPDESSPCGGTFAQHSLAHLAVLKAVADHQLEHLGAEPAMVAEIYQDAMASFHASDQAAGSQL